MDDFDALLARMEQKAERVEKPVPVDLPGIGRIYVRARLVEEVNTAEQAALNGEISVVARGCARLLCTETGERVSNESRERFAKALARLPESDLVAISIAADFDKEQPKGN